MRARPKKAVTILVAAVVLLGAALGFGRARRAYQEAALRRDVSRLLEVASTQSIVRSRLSGSRAPRHIDMRSGTRASKPIGLYTAADAVLSRASLVDSRDASRASAVAHYCIGEFGLAVRDLEKLVAETPDAAAWNDLAAARFERWRTEKLSFEVVPALVAIDRAIAADPAFPAALYNRAAILEHMGLRRHAREAWRVALVAERDPAWRAEIGARMEVLSSAGDDSPAPPTFAALAPDDSAAIRDAVARFPQDARRYAEALLPVEWAAAVAKGDAATAARMLGVARALALALRDRSGETFAAEAIDAIDEASKNGRAAELASAYSAYAEGRALRSRDSDAAETKLAEAAERFERANSPMANVARYSVATAILELNRVDEAAARYRALVRAEHGASGHRGFAAQLAWHVARAEGIRGHWDAALEAAQEAVNEFRLLGERQNTGFMENMLAELYDYLGQPERAWRHRLVAFDLLSASGNAQRLQVSLGAAARERIRRRDWPAAVALLDLEIGESRRAGDPSLLGDVLARRARARAAVGDASRARQDVAAARSAALRVKDVQLRAQVVATVDAAEGFVERESDPEKSVRLFTSAIDFYQSTSTILLPELYLERGRAHLARRSENEAASDFRSGIDRLEEQRATASDFDLYSTAADVGEDLYIEAVRLAARRGEVERAYRLSERSRGRALARRLGAADALAPTKVEPRTRIVELMSLPEKLLVFTVDRELRMKEIDIRRDAIEAMVDSLTHAILDDASPNDVQAAAAKLYDAILRPAGAVAGDASTLVFVATGSLERVPWSTLYDREQRRYLVEDSRIQSAPSATLYARSASSGVSRTRDALIVGNPKIAASFVDLPVLRGAEEEARSIAAFYSAPAVLLGADATVARVTREAQGRDVLHFAAHAVSSETSEDQSFLVLAPDEEDGDSGMLYSRDIANLSLRGVSHVVLAACGTLRGQVVHIDGVPNIARSFLAAGARSVIGTLWDVDDDRSSSIFASIHRDLARGRPVVDAVRDAQLDAIRRGESAKTWGGLMVIGGGS